MKSDTNIYKINILVYRSTPTCLFLEPRWAVHELMDMWVFDGPYSAGFINSIIVQQECLLTD